MKGFAEKCLAGGGSRIQASVAKFIMRLNDQLVEMDKCWQQHDSTGLVALWGISRRLDVPDDSELAASA